MLQVKSFQFNPIQENTYLVYNEFNECAIIDPGCYSDEEKNLFKNYINSQGLTPIALLNTHCHLDHIFGNAFIADAFNLELSFHESESYLFDMAPVSGLQYDLPFTNYTGKVNYLPATGNISIGQDELEILFTPGHSPGSLSFYSKKDNFVICGDALFQRSIGRTDLPQGDHETLLKSIQEKLFTLPEETIVYSGHGSTTTIGEEIKYNPFFN